MQQSDVGANVVLTADNSGYNQTMAASAQSTNQMIAAVDTLASKLNDLTKTAGKVAIGFGGAQLATITGATAAWASYEKQISSLNAQAAVLNRTFTTGDNNMKAYAKSVENLRTNFGTSTASAAQLTQTVSKMTDGTTGIVKLATTFERMSKATGESSTGLAQSVLGLQKVMGTPQSNTSKYADQLTTLAAGANTTASALANFTSQMAPVGRLIGQSQTDITGIATAFSKAGQDGYQAATVYNKFISDIAYATKSGSPDLAKYANLVGVTVDQFKQLSGTDQIVKIMDSINRQGPAAIVTLNRMGLDGTRTVRAITALSNQGGLGTAVRQARDAYGNNATREGARAGMKGLSDEWQAVSENVAQSFEAIGSSVGPAVEQAAKGIDAMTKAFKELAQGPMGQLIGWITGIVGVASTGAGAFLLMAGAILKVAAAFTVMRSSASRGVIEGFRGGGRITEVLDDQGNRTGTYAGTSRLGATGSMIAASGASRPGLRFLYNSGQAVGSAVGGAGRTFAENYMTLRRAMNSEYEPNPQGRFGQGYGFGGMMSRAAGLTGAAIQTLITPQMDQMRFRDPRDRLKVIQTSAPDLSPRQHARLLGAINSQYDAEDRVAAATAERARLRSDPNAPSGARSKAAQEENLAKASLAAQQRSTAASVALAASQQQAAAAAKANATAVTSNTTATATGFKRLGVAVTEFTARLATASVAGVGAAAKTGAGFLGSAGAALGIGAGAGIGGSAVGIGMLGLMLYPLIKSMFPSDESNYSYQNLASGNASYYQKGGVATPTAVTAGYATTGETSKALTLGQAKRITAGDINQATSSNYELTNSNLKGMNKDQAKIFLSGAYADLASSPQAMNAMTLDLINLYGAGGAKEIMDSLSRGDMPGVGTIRMKPVAGTGGKGEFSATIGRDSSHIDFGNQQIGYLSQQLVKAGSRGKAGSAAGALFGYAQSSAAAANLTPEQAQQVYRDNMLQAAQVFQVPEEMWGSGDARKEALKSFQSTFGFNPQGKEDRQYAISARDIATKMTAKAMGAGIDESTWASMQNISSRNPEDAKKLLVSMGMSQEEADRLGNSPKHIQEALIKLMTTAPPESEMKTLEDRINSVNDGLGAVFTASSSVAESIKSPDNANLIALAGSDVLNQLRGKTGLAGQVRTLTGVMGEVGDPTEQRYLIAQAGLGQLQTRLRYQSPFMTGAQQVGANAQILQGMISGYNPNDPNAQQQLTAQAGATMESITAQAQTFYSMLQQQKQLQRSQEDFSVSVARSDEDFAKQRGRAEHDFALQRKWSLQDFNLQRRWSESDFNLQRRRALQDYSLQEHRAQKDFALSRERSEQDFRTSQKRNEQDFHHQVDRMVEQNAKNYYNIYQRAQVQNTWSAQGLLGNNAMQTDRLVDQSNMLGKLRKAGVNSQTIDQLDLTNPQNYQQLQRLVDEISNDPQLAKQLNKGIDQRVAAAAALTKDKSNKQWDEYVYQFNTAVSRASEDFNKQMARSSNDFNKQMERSQKDFNKQLSRQDKDFDKQMDRSQEQFETTLERNAEQFRTQMGRNASDYATSMTRMRQDMSKQMRRAQEDMDTLARGMSAGLKDILEDSVGALNGSAKKQAQKVLNTFNGIHKTIGGSGNDIMLLLSDIFGFDYKPKKIKSSMPVIPQDSMENKRKGMGYAEGGVLPGNSKGRDDLHYVDQYGRDLHLSGGEGIMVPEFVQKHGGPEGIKRLNAAARYGKSFAKGGVFWPLPGGKASTYSGHDGVDLNAPDDYGKPFYAAAAGKVSYTGYGHGYGNAIFIKGPYGTLVYGHGSNVAVHAGQRVRAGQYIGNVGSTGNSTGPHLHFGFPGGSYSQAMAFLRGANVSGYGSAGSGVGDVATLDDFMALAAVKRAMSDVERSGDKFKMGGGFPNGFWDKKMSSAIGKAWKKAAKKYGAPDVSEIMGSGLADGPRPDGNNQELVRKAMLNAGFSSGQWGPLYQLVMHESGFRNTAQNPTSSAYGMFQFLDSTWKSVGGTKTSDPWKQAQYGLKYIKSRYGSPSKAWDFWQRNNWYGDGAIFNEPTTIGVGERGAEAVVPLNEKGADLMYSLMERYSAGSEAKGVGLPGGVPVCVHNENTYNLDRSTQFSGPITVQANNPAELTEMIAARQRVMALTQPVLSGRRP